MNIIDNFELKNISWVKIGGPADRYIELANQEEFIAEVKEILKEGDKFEIIGWGANTLISDNGIRKSVIKCKTGEIKILDKVERSRDFVTEVEENTNERYQVDQEYNISKGYKHGYMSDDINYTEPDADDILVKIDAGVSLPYTINYLIEKGITGLHMFTGIPGTIGGSVFNNIHGGPRLISEFIDSIEVINPDGNLVSLSKEELDLDYNKTRLQKSGEIIISATLRLKLGDKARSRAAAVEWARRKASQPKNSLGSVFHNLTEDDKTKYNLPSVSAGYLIDHVLKLRGYRVGNIMIPEEENTNIFINLGNGTASDFLAVMKKVYNEAYQQLGVKFRPEIYLKGFSDQEIEEFL